MAMSWGRLSTPLAPEDDWFIEPDVEPSTDHEEPRERRTSDPEPREGASGPPESRGAKGLGGERSRKLVAAAVVGAIVFIGGALVATLAARALSGGDETTTSTLTRTTTVTTTSPTTTSTTTTPTTSSAAELPQGVVLRRGDESGDVSEVQAALVELGYSTGSVDGKFGPATEQAVRDFQQSSSLKQDGLVGPTTLAALSAALNGQ